MGRTGQSSDVVAQDLTDSVLLPQPQPAADTQPPSFMSAVSVTANLAVISAAAVDQVRLS